MALRQVRSCRLVELPGWLDSSNQNEYIDPVGHRCEGLPAANDEPKQAGGHMPRLLHAVLAAICCGPILALAGEANVPAAPKVQVLIVTGHQNTEHDWRGMEVILRKVLEDTGRFEVKVSEEFRGATDETLAPYDVVLINFHGKDRLLDPGEIRWGERAERALFDFVKLGKGVVVYHSSFAMGDPSWPEFEHMALSLIHI